MRESGSFVSIRQEFHFQRFLQGRHCHFFDRRHNEVDRLRQRIAKRLGFNDFGACGIRSRVYMR